jgi:LuxR family maltose regulon positive regulatory protein
VARSDTRAQAERTTTQPQPQPGPEALPFDVVATKIRVPTLRSGLVSRTALVNRLRATASIPVITLSAPAGYGKTTVLAQWAARDPRPVAWISIDERDRDPIVLLRHFAAALHGTEPLDPYVVEALAEPGASMWTAALPRLCSALNASEPIVIVLDDAHLLHAGEPLDAVAVLADQVPEGSVLVVAGRVPPHRLVAALRVSGRLLEIGADQLVLTPKEGHLLLRAAGVDVTPEEVTKLVRDCEGWPAALYLMSLALRDVQTQPADDERATPFVARDESLAEYVRTQYLARLPASALRFLTRTSILEQMCGGLCDAVLGRGGSARELERIEQSNLFLVTLDRQRIWFRYHHLFRDVLRRELARQESSTTVAALHRRAADWYEAHGDPESALDHARSAGDLRRVARILEEIALPLYHSGRVATVEVWLAQFDDAALLRRYPSIALQGSWIHVLRGRSADAERWLGIAEDALSESKSFARRGTYRAWIAAIRAALCRDGVYQMIADAESALIGVSRDDSVRPSALMLLGAGYLLLGQPERADVLLTEAAAEAHRLGAIDTEVVAIGERSIIAAAQNDGPAAERLADEAHGLVDEASLDGYETTAIALAASARASLLHGRWDDARADLEKVRGSAGRGLPPWFAVQTRLESARAHLALRETEAVDTLLAEIHDLLRERPHVGVLVDEVETLEREVEAISEGAPRAGLTSAELRLLPYLSTHLSLREIGDELMVSRNTIKTQAISVYRKLGVASRSEAIACATRLGLVELEGMSSEQA